ncbi:MAG: hypothetical protein ACI9OB_000448, partial [Nonlabens sp.]
MRRPAAGSTRAPAEVVPRSTPNQHEQSGALRITLTEEHAQKRDPRP